MFLEFFQLHSRLHRWRPSDSKCWIIPPYASRARWNMKLRHLVEHFCAVLQGQESMGESLWDMDHSAIVRGQFHCHPLLEGGRIMAQVNDHVIDLPHGTS